MKNTTLDKHSIGRILIALFCLITAISTAVVMFSLYDPSQNALKALSCVCMDIICMIIIYIFIGSFAFGSYGTNRTTRVFSILLIATIWALFTDFLNWAFDGSLQFGHLTFWFTLASLCMGSVLGCIFSIYLNSYMDEMHQLSKMRPHASVCAIINLVSFVLTFVLGVTQTAFKFVDGHYEVGPLYDVITVLPVISLLYLTGYVIRYVKVVGIHDVFAAAGYILFMIAGALIEADKGIGTTYVSVAIADVYIFVMLQNEIIAREKRNVQEWMQKSNTDELTGFLNRHAYENDIKTLENGTLEDDFVYVSMDVNSLKAVNDSNGHNAGDELLVGAAECLQKCFGPYGKIYRTGGDEFIALVCMNEQQLKIARDEIDELTKSWNGKMVQGLALSCGYVTRKEVPEMTVRQMAVLADKRMYEDKDEYYRRTGLERRRK